MAYKLFSYKKENIIVELKKGNVFRLLLKELTFVLKLVR